MNCPERLIEVDLPIKQISAHARREKSIRHGHILALHIPWARRPQAMCRLAIWTALWSAPAALGRKPVVKVEHCSVGAAGILGAEEMGEDQ